jgi:hypothetical protein
MTFLTLSCEYRLGSKQTSALSVGGSSFGFDFGPATRPSVTGNLLRTGKSLKDARQPCRDAGNY